MAILKGFFEKKANIINVMQIDFMKMHGLGNDFIIVNCLENSENVQELIDIAEELCDRRFGIGGDGLILVLPSKKDDFMMRIINSDGSEPEMCGNGIRCFAKFLYETKITDKLTFTVETLAGTIVPEIILEEGVAVSVKVDMGEPELVAKRVPMAANEEQAINYPLKVNDTLTLNVTAVSMGNPHAVTFVDDVWDYPVEEVGAIVEINKEFPKKTNVEFAEIVDCENIKMRVWERGAGITLACGTGACATLVAAVLNGLTERAATVELPGGPLKIEWSAENNRIYMTGPAEMVFEGAFEIF